MRAMVTQVLLAFALAGLVLPKWAWSADCDYTEGPAEICSTDHKILQSQQRNTTVVFPNATKTLTADGTVTVSATDICSNTANGIPCLDSATKLSTSVIPNLSSTLVPIYLLPGSLTGTGSLTATATNATSTNTGTRTVTATATGTGTSAGTGTVTGTQTVSGTASATASGTASWTGTVTGIGTGVSTTTETNVSVGNASAAPAPLSIGSTGQAQFDASGALMLNAMNIASTFAAPVSMSTGRIGFNYNPTNKYVVAGYASVFSLALASGIVTFANAPYGTGGTSAPLTTRLAWCPSGEIDIANSTCGSYLLRVGASGLAGFDASANVFAPNITLTPMASAIPQADTNHKIDVGWLPVGTTAGTVAAGDDSRIAGALQTSTVTGSDVLVDVTSGAITATHALTSANVTSALTYTPMNGTVTHLSGDVPISQVINSHTLTSTNITITAADVGAVASNTAISASGATNKIVQYDAKGLVLSGTTAGNAATKDVGTTAGTVAAGDDSRIVGALQSLPLPYATATGNLTGTGTGTATASTTATSTGTLTITATVTGTFTAAGTGTITGTGTHTATGYATLTKTATGTAAVTVTGTGSGTSTVTETNASIGNASAAQELLSIGTSGQTRIRPAGGIVSSATLSMTGSGPVADFGPNASAVSLGGSVLGVGSIPYIGFNLVKPTLSTYAYGRGSDNKYAGLIFFSTSVGSFVFSASPAKGWDGQSFTPVGLLNLDLGGNAVFGGAVSGSNLTSGGHGILDLDATTPLAASGGDYAFAYRTGTNTSTDTSTGTGTSCPLNRACTMVRTSTTTATATVTNSVNGIAISSNPTLTYSNVGAPPTSRTISTSNGLQGGHDLSADFTLSPVYGSAVNTVMEGNDRSWADPAGAANAVTTTSIGAVPTARTVCGHALSSNVSCTYSDVGADVAGAAAAVSTTSIGAVPTSTPTLSRAFFNSISSAGGSGSTAWSDVATQGIYVSPTTGTEEIRVVVNYTATSGTPCCIRILMDSTGVSPSYDSCMQAAGPGSPKGNVSTTAWSYSTSTGAHTVHVQIMNGGGGADVCYTYAGSVQISIIDHGTM